MQILNPGFNVFQTLNLLFKRSRAFTFYIHKYVYRDKDNWVCNYYNKIYKYSGDIGIMFKHLKEKYLIDAIFSDIIEKRIRKGTNIDVVIFCEIEINIKTEKKKKKQLINIEFNKNILEYLYFQ